MRSAQTERPWCDSCALKVSQLERSGILKVADMSGHGVPAFLCMWAIYPVKGMLDLSGLVEFFGRENDSASRRRIAVLFGNCGVRLAVIHDLGRSSFDDAPENDKESQVRTEASKGDVLSAITKKITRNRVDHRYFCGNLGQLFVVEERDDGGVEDDKGGEDGDDGDEGGQSGRSIEPLLDLTEWVAEIARTDPSKNVEVTVYWDSNNPDEWTSKTLSVSVMSISDPYLRQEEKKESEGATTTTATTTGIQTADKAKQRKAKSLTKVAPPNGPKASKTDKTRKDQGTVGVSWKKVARVACAIATIAASLTAAITMAWRTYDAFFTLAASILE